MAIIVEFPGRDVNRYARRPDELGASFGEVLLFTGVRHERAEDFDYSSQRLSDDQIADGGCDVGHKVKTPKSAG